MLRSTTALAVPLDDEPRRLADHRPDAANATALEPAAGARKRRVLAPVAEVSSLWPSRKSDSGTSGLRLGHNAKLLHHPERVPATPALNDLAVRDPVDADPLDLHRLAGRRHAHQLTVIGAFGRPTGDDEVALGDLLVNLEATVREGGLVHLRVALCALRPVHLAEGV